MSCFVFAQCFREVRCYLQIILISLRTCTVMKAGISSTLQKYKKNRRRPYLLGLKLAKSLKKSMIFCKMNTASKQYVMFDEHCEVRNTLDTAKGMTTIEVVA